MRKKILLLVLFFVLTVLAVVTLMYTQQFRPEGTPSTMTSVQPTITPNMHGYTEEQYKRLTTRRVYESKNGLLRYGQDNDKLGSGALQSVFQGSVTSSISQRYYESTVPKTEKVYLAEYKGPEEIPLDGIDISTIQDLSKIVSSKISPLFSLKYVYVDDLLAKRTLNEPLSNLIVDPKTNSLKRQGLFLQYLNNKLVLSTENIYYPLYGLGTVRFDNKTNTWKIHYTLGLHPTGQTQEAKLLSFDQFSNLLEKQDVYMFWTEKPPTEGGNIYLPIGKEDSIVFNEIRQIYIAQSEGFIPGFLVCGQAIYAKPADYNGTYNLDGKVCGITEAVDYGDY